ncbi:MAG: hypothetical protein K9H64_00190 [Bacteroidales bacterium]|nr:hypothetical protein [Bacteroidales bacterium]MCF8454313.1 hypothetical protein [Bacteroidales bacterium]
MRRDQLSILFIHPPLGGAGPTLPYCKEGLVAVAKIVVIYYRPDYETTTVPLFKGGGEKSYEREAYVGDEHEPQKLKNSLKQLKPSLKICEGLGRIQSTVSSLNQ